MFRFLKKSFGQHTNSLTGAAFIIGGMTLLSQICALIRDRLLAHYIGPGPVLDMYYASFRIPDILLISIGSLFATTALIPFLMETLHRDKDAETVSTHEYTEEFINTILTGYCLLMGTVLLIAFFCLPYLVPYLFSGFTDSAILHTIFLARVLLVQVFFLGLSYIFQSLNQAFKRVILYALSPIIYNFGIILGTVLLYPIWGISGVTYGVVAGAFLHMIIQFYGVYEYLFTPKIIRRVSFARVRTVILHSLPRTVSLAVINFTITALLALASRLPAGSISFITFAYGIQSVPVGMVGTSFALASFPTLVDQMKNTRETLFPKTLEKMIRDIVFWSTPCVVFFVFARMEMVEIMLGGKNFSESSVYITSTVLAVFMISTVFQSLTTLFSRVYFAAEKTRYALWINIFASLVSLLIAYGILYFVAVPYTLRIYVLAGAFSFGQVLITLLFVFLSKKHVPEILSALVSSMRYFKKILLLNTLYLGGLFTASYLFLILFTQGSFYVILAYLTFVGVFGGFLWVYVAHRLHMAEIVPLVQKFKIFKSL